VGKLKNEESPYGEVRIAAGHAEREAGADLIGCPSRRPLAA